MTGLTTSYLIDQYTTRHRMVEGYTSSNNYATPDSPGRNSTREEDDKELTEIEFKLHVLHALENLGK